MQLLEANFAQIEHINQILNNSRGYEGWACFDTHYLIKAHNDMLKLQYPNDTTAQTNNKIGTYNESDPKKSKITAGIANVRYDSFIVSISKITDGWQYSFDVRNTLWDGSYRITKSKNSSEDTSETFEKSNILITRDKSNENNVVFNITGTDSDRVRICFHYTTSGKKRNIQTNSIRISNPNEYTHQFDETVCEPGHIYNENGKAVSGAEITIEPVNSSGLPITSGIPTYTTKTDDKGYYKVCYGAVEVPGDYYVLMRATYNSIETTKLIHINKIQEQSLHINFGDADQYKDVIKGSIKTFKINVHVTDEHGIHDTKLDEKIMGLTLNVSLVKLGGKTDNIQTCKIKKDGSDYVITPEISFRDYYEDTSRLVVEVPISTGFGNGHYEQLIRHSWFVANNFNALLTEVNKTKGTDWIFLKTINYTCTETLNITRTITIAGLIGDNQCVLDGDNHNIISINAPSPAVDNYMEVNLIGITFKNAQPAINENTGCRLLVDKCYFTSNQHSNKHHCGCSIYMPITDKTRKTHNLWKTEIRNSRFHNNKGNEIQSIGKTLIHNCMFTTTSKVYLQQPEVKVVSVRAGEVTYKNNKSYINIPFNNKSDAMDSNHSYAKALTYVDTNCKFNGVGPSGLQANNTLPLFKAPWNNQAYTRACYYYPYENVKTYIVCSPEHGKERRATGHASSSKNWVFYDGYYFTRLENSKGNLSNPWTESELELPGNMGIYNETSKKFTLNYDPKFSGSKSKTSEV